MPVRPPAPVLGALLLGLLALPVAADALLSPRPVAFDAGTWAGPASADPPQAPPPAAEAAPGAPQIEFRCPSSPLPQSPPDPRNLGDKTTYGCPFRIYDGADAREGFPLGNPQIAVSPANPAEAAFVSLHGQPEPDAPTPRARRGLTHTAFTTADQGLTWEDQPTQYGGSADGMPYLGESASIAMDSQGRMYLAYLWVLPNGNATTGYGSAIGLFKAGTPQEPGTVAASYAGQHTIASRSSHGIIPRVDVVAVAPARPPVANLTVANATLGPASDADIGKSAVPVEASQERVAAVWFERAPDPTATGMPGWIDAALTDTSGHNAWTRLSRPQLIGPCRDASNPVAWNGLVYVACQADRGYDARSRARIGDIDLWAIDPWTGNTTLVGPTGLQGGHPLLAATPDGYMVLVAVTPRADRSLDARTAFGWHGTRWTLGGNIGPELHRMGGGVALQDAAITALAVSEGEKTVALVYMEWAQRDGSVPVQPPPLPDPTRLDPSAGTPALTDFRKHVVAFNECQFPLASSRLQLGTSVDPHNLNAYLQRPSAFDDFQDGLVAYREPSGEDLFYFAVGDYGAIQYGAIVAQSASAFCQVVPPLFSPAPAALPQALTVGSPATMAIGATAGAAAAAMVGYLLTAKRRAARTLAAEDRR